MYNILEDKLPVRDYNMNGRAQFFTPNIDRHFSNSQYEICMKPVTHILKFLAGNLFNTRNGRRATFPFSVSFIYSILVYATVNFLSIYSIYENRKDIKDSDDFELKIEFVQDIIDCLLLCILPVTSWLENKRHVLHFSYWKSFEVKFSETTRFSLILKSRRRIKIISVILLIFIITYYTSWELFYYVQDSKYDVLGYCLFLYSEVLMGMVIMQWYFSCLLISDAAENMFTSFKRDLTGNNMPVKVITRYSPLWLKLSELTVEFGDCFGCTYCVCIIYMFSKVTICIYWTIYEIQLHNYELICDAIVPAVYNAFYIFLIGNSAHCVTKKITSGMVQILLKVEQDIYDCDIQRAVYLFFKRMDTCPAEITLYGFVSVNRGLIVSLGTMIITYIIILLQFDMAFGSSVFHSSSEAECNCTGNTDT